MELLVTEFTTQKNIYGLPAAFLNLRLCSKRTRRSSVRRGARLLR